MSQNLALHVLVSFTEQVVPIYKHITVHWYTKSGSAK